MSSTFRRPHPIIIVSGIVVLVVVAVWGAELFAASRRNSTKTSLAKGYATQSLAAPFTLVARIWQPGAGPFATAGTWKYEYVAYLSEAATLSAAKTQLGRGAYQVDGNHPDVIGESSSTLYRDLITEDVALKVIIGPPDEAAPGSTVITAVTVTLSPQSGD